MSRASRPRRRRTEGGAAAILIALLTVVMVGCLAFVTDFGMAYANKRMLQNAADAAALAAARTVANDASATQGCTLLANDPANAGIRSSAWSTASYYLRANAPTATAPAASPPADFFSCDAKNRLKVSVSASMASPAFFAGVLTGASNLPLRQSAAAVMGVSGKPPVVRPIAICQQRANDLINAGVGQAVIYPLGQPSSCWPAPGNWGVLGFDGTNSGNGVASWITNGWTGPITMAPGYQTGNPGFDSSSAVRAAYGTILDKDIIMPVFDTSNGEGGDNAGLRIVGFLSVQFCAWQTSSGNSGTGSCADPVKLAQNASSPTGYDKFFMLRLKRTITPAQLTDCTLADSACDFALRTVKLAQ